MTWHDFTIRFTTPAFLGQDPTHAQPGAHITFPIPSLRGALRFWLRAIVGAFTSDLDAIHDAETRVFGAAAGDTIMPSPILLRAPKPVPIAAPGADEPWLRPRAGQAFTKYHTYYLLGQGLWAERKLARRHVKPNTEVTIRVRNTGDAASGDLFLAALWALRTFGGLGSRTRRGFGTFDLVEPPSRLASGFDPTWLGPTQGAGAAAPFNEIMLFLLRLLADLRTRGHAGPPQFPCFARTYWHTDEIGLGQRSLADALAHTGHILRQFYTQRGEPSPEYDHIARPYLGNPHAAVNATPLIRGAMGLPVNYGDSDGPPNTWRNAVVEPVLDGEPTRRASPLWLRILPNGSTWNLRWLLFVTDWMPPTATLRIRNTRNPHLPTAPVRRPSDDDALTEMRRWTSYMTARQG